MTNSYRKQFFDGNGAYLTWNLSLSEVPPGKQREAQDQFLRAWQNARKAEKALELLMMFFRNL